VQKGFKAHYARVSQTKEKPMQAFDRYYWTAALAGLPSYGGSKTKEKNHHNADERQ
jgi:hypothetical protein